MIALLFIEPLLISAGFVLTMSALVYILVPFVLRGSKQRSVVAASFGILLTALTIFFLQGHSVFFREEASVLSRLQEARHWWGHPSTDFIDSNFILVNTAASPQLIPDKTAFSEDSAKTVITDRQQLTEALKGINTLGNKVNLVVCDLVFADPTSYDSALLAELQKLERANKLLLAYNPDFASAYPSFYEGFDVSSFGDVTKVKEEAFYFSHQLLTDEGLPSLPYAMYLKLGDGPVPVRNGSSLKEPGYWVRPNFIPAFEFVNEDLLYHRQPFRQQPVVKTKIESEFSNDLRTQLSTGKLSTTDGKQELADLIYLKGGRHRNIIFFGNFSDAYADRHATAYGNLYGTTILLNEYNALCKGYHRISTFGLLMYVIVLFLGYFSILKLLLRQRTKGVSMHDSSVDKKNKQDKNFLNVVSGRKIMQRIEAVFLPLYQKMRQALDASASNYSLWEWIKSTVGFLIGESYSLCLFILVLVVDALFYKVVNVMGLLYFFLVLSALLKFFISRYSARQQSIVIKTKQHETSAMVPSTTAVYQPDSH